VCALSAHHRFGGPEVRHCCATAGLEGNIVWSDPLSGHAKRIGRLYAGALGAADPGSRGAPVATHPDGTPASLVSFLLTI
jgi:hypothetical protein